MGSPGKSTALSKMKVFAACFALVALTSAFKIEAKKTELITRSDQCYDDPDTTDCPGGCCPHPNWFCCADNINCAPTSADCRLDAKMAKLTKLAKSKQCGPDETDCPGGCCPMPNWFCCPDATYCAATAADCPFEAGKTRLIKLAKSKQCPPETTDCPMGCCPMPNWYCCPSGFCAETAAECPGQGAFEERKAPLVKMAKIKQCGPEETNCLATGGGGCCPEANWFCCDDVTVCAPTAADCPFESRTTQLVKTAKIKQCGPDETTCPGGCCPEANWYCCPDAYYCAATAADCPFEARKLF